MSSGPVQTTKEWIKRFAAPPLFHQRSRPYQCAFGLVGLILFLVGSLWGLGWAPPDYQQGESFRIIYIHVPASFLA